MAILLSLLGLSPVFLLVALALFFSRTRHSAQKQAPRQNGVALEFFPAPRMQFLVKLVLILLLAFTLLFTWAIANSGGSFYALLGPLSVLLLIYLASPVSVIVDQSGIKQRGRFGRDREISWDDIAWVARGPNTGTTYVRSKKGGPKIRFSAFLVGRTRFLHEIRVHVRDVEVLNGDD